MLSSKWFIKINTFNMISGLLIIALNSLIWSLYLFIIFFIFDNLLKAFLISFLIKIDIFTAFVSQLSVHQFLQKKTITNYPEAFTIAFFNHLSCLI